MADRGGDGSGARQIEVRVVVLGRAVLRVLSGPDGVLADVLESAGIEPAGRDVHVNGLPRGLDEPVADGDLVTVIPRVRGG